MKLTKIQEDTLTFMIEYHVEKNRPATYREIAKEFDITVKSAWDRVISLRKKGYVINGDSAIASGIETTYKNGDSYEPY